MADERNIPLPITVELAVSDPSGFKENLLLNLRNRPEAGKVWNVVSERSGIGLDTITLNPQSWIGHSDSENGIVLGVASIPRELKQKLLFEDVQFSYPDTVLYRLIHELTHKFVAFSSNPKMLDSIFESMIQIRKQNPNLGLTALGSLAFYRNQSPEIQAKEDVVEMATMYLWDEEYFNRYLSFLTTSNSRDVLSGLGLRKISSDSSNNLKSLIGSSIKQELK